MIEQPAKTWSNVQRMLRTAGIDACFLSVAVSSDFVPDEPFPFGATVFAAFFCNGRYVNIGQQNPMVPHIIRRARLLMKRHGFRLDVVEMYRDGVELSIIPTPTEDIEV